VRYFVEVGGVTVEVEVERRADGSYSVRGPDGQVAQVASLGRNGRMNTLLVAGQVLEVLATDGEAEVKLALDRFSVHARSERDHAVARAGSSEAQSSREIVAPMPGRIVRIACAPGDAVAKGAPLVVIEAMKMQNELCAKADSVVRAVRIAAGDTVDRGAVLIELE
jgi:biotin carboxyl carrier protein